MNGSLTGKLKMLLSRPGISLLVLVLAIFARFIQLIFFYSIRFDGSYQVIASHNLLEGHGITIHEVFANDLSEIIYQPLVNWPPGYSLLLAPFHVVTGNYIISGILLDMIAALALLVYSRKILKLFDTPVYLVNIFTLLTGFFLYYFYLVASSDSVAISFFIAGIYYSFAFLKSGRLPVSNMVAVTTLLGISAAIKYLFIPVVLIVPVSLWSFGILTKKQVYRKAGMYAFISLLIIIAAMLAWQKVSTGSAGYISQPGRGFFPEHLLRAWPFIPASFLQPDTIATLTGSASETGSGLYRIFQAIHVILLVTGLYFLARSLARTDLRNISLINSFIFLTVSIAFTLTALLAALSLFVPMEQILPGWWWTYVEEARYYGLATVLIQLCIFLLYGNYGAKIREVFLIALVFLATEAARGMIFTANRVINYNKEEYNWQYEYRFQQYADSLLADIEMPIALKVVTGSSHYMNNRVSVYSRIPVLNDNQIINDASQLKTTKPMLLMVIIHEKELPNFKPFIEGRLAVGSFEGYHFYKLYVRPE